MHCSIHAISSLPVTSASCFTWQYTNYPHYPKYTHITPNYIKDPRAVQLHHLTEIQIKSLTGRQPWKPAVKGSRIRFPFGKKVFSGLIRDKVQTNWKWRSFETLKANLYSFLGSYCKFERQSEYVNVISLKKCSAFGMHLSTIQIYEY